ncbi:chemotaxis protein CheC [Clostridium cylindrosporum]|uniref:CheY-P phosphatase CheC n=1 Tax=Clostridium cylindrosporum DSM 605 TaxID=1121307 RepID=A0A0J8D6G7_CLOCY|nr:chemotaxis protein CheC [Clostridium cylindrosporum]KMT21680.1 CheY-P phosphatase CheC [Clostridium cylindrosporum DSM 605]
MDKALNELQLDALREVGNIGAGNAATALSQILNKKIDMMVPKVDVVPFDNIVEKLGNEEKVVVAVLLKVFGDAPGNILFVMDEKKSQEFSSVMLAGFEDVPEEMHISVFQEIGNILGNSYIGAISQITGLNLISSVPAVATDMVIAVLTTTFLDAEQYSDYVLSIDTNFIDEYNKESGGSIFYVPKPGSLDKILTKLGLN